MGEPVWETLRRQRDEQATRDTTERIADALERIADSLAQIEGSGRIK